MLDTNSLDAGYELCRGITQEQLKLSTYYLEKVAASDDIEGQLSFFKATPLEIEGYSDQYVPTPKESEYLDSLFKRKVQYLENAVESGSIDAALQLSMSYSDDVFKTVTGYNQDKALEYLMLANLMDYGNNVSTIEPLLEFTRLQIPAYKFEDIKRRVSESFEEKKTFYINRDLSITDVF